MSQPEQLQATLEQSKIALEFLKKFYPKGPWTLTAISLDKQSLPTRTFGPKSEDECLLFIDEHNGKMNLYFHVNPVKHAISKKAKISDLASMAWLHVDVDPRSGKDLTAERERIGKMVTVGLPAGVPPPSCVNFSGGGYQAFWRLTNPVAIDGNDPDELAKYNVKLSEVFGADNCHNLDRIMRLPGTWNIPDNKKKQKGRFATLAFQVHFDNHSYELSDFQKAQPKHVAGASGSSETIRVPRVEPVQIDEVTNLKMHLDPEKIKEIAQSTIDDLGAMIVQGTYSDPSKLQADKEAGKDISRSKFVFTVACQLWRWGMAPEKIVGILLNPDFQISDSILEQKDALGYAWKQVDSAATITSAEEKPGGGELVELNSSYMFVANINRILHERYDETMGRMVLDFLSVEAFKNALNNRYVEVMTNDKPSLRKLGDFWMTHPQRRTYQNIIFSPANGDLKNSYNLWKGFSVQPKDGDCGLFLDHLKNIICSGNDEYYRYLIGWLARMIQTPETQSEVAVLLQGGPGTGKSVVGKIIGSLLGPHYQSLSNADRITGKFNAHLRDCLFLFADEALMVQNKKVDADVKDLITSPTHTIEGKGIEVQTCGNFIHLMMATNEEYALPIQAGERRYLVLKVSNASQQDLEYFAKLEHQMFEEGGREALLNFLLNYDLSKFNVRAVPKTEAFKEIQIQTMNANDSVVTFWYELLINQETLPGVGRWMKRVKVHDLHKAYVEWAEPYKHMRVSAANAFGRKIRKLHPSIESRVIKLPKSDKTAVFYEFGTIEKARHEFEAYQGPIDWPFDGQIVEGEPDEDESPF